MLPGARSDASLMADSRDEAPPGAVASDATSAPAVAAWELLDARRTLREWTLTRFLAARPAAAPVVFSADTTIGAALTRMADAGILSAPVLDAMEGHPASSWLGFLDVSDIVTALLKELYPWLLDEPHRSTSRGMMAALATDSESVSEVMREWARELFMLRWVRTVRPGSDGDFLYRGLGYKTLLDVVSRGLQNLPVGMRPWGDLRPAHRIAVFDVEEQPTIGSGARVGGSIEAVKITAVVSQTDLIAFLLFQAQSGRLGPSLPSRTVASLGWVRRDVVTVPRNMPAVAAFALMLNRGVSGAGVVDGDAFDADAPLLSSLSVSDIRALRTAADFSALALPVDQFLLRQYGEAMPEHAASAAPPAAPREGSPAETVASTAAQVAAMAVDVAGGGGGEVTAVTFQAAAAEQQRLPSAADVASAMEQPAAEQQQPRLWLVHCSPESTLREVLETFVLHCVHRVYIVDGQMRPLGVVTMSDVLQLIAMDPANDPQGWLETSVVAY